MKHTLKTIPYMMLLLTASISSSALYAADTTVTPTKSVIFFLGDGMGPTTVTASRIYAVGENGKLAMDRMKHAARIKTYSEDGQTTDSAPSMGAYMTGQKNKNEVIAMTTGTVAVEPEEGKLPNGKSLAKAINRCPEQGSSMVAGMPALSILELAKKQGKAVGVVTTTELTHATPAATYAHICHRDAQYDIALQAVPKGKAYNPNLLDGINVLMGGGLNHWTPYDAVSNPKGRLDGRDLLAEFKQQGYQTVLSQSDLAQTVNTQKIFGVFSTQSHLNFDLDRLKKNIETEPSLAAMTSKAIDALQAQSHGQGYFLMVEGGRIDHALHANNAKRALQETKAFNDAIQTALDKVDLSNTLIVVTADHDHVMTFNGYAARTGQTTETNPGILGLSYDYNIAKEQNAYSKVLADGQVHNPYRDVNGATGTTLVFGNGTGKRLDIRDSISNEQAFADDYKQEVGVQLTKSETHGGGDVMLFAEGKNSNLFKGTQENTWVFEQLKKGVWILMDTRLIRPFKFKMKFLALSFSLLSPWVWSADEYRIDYQIERLDANGVTTIQKYSEKIIRDEQNIWIERLNTQTHADEAQTHSNAHVSAKTDTHEHVSFDSAIQWMQRKDVVGQANVESPFQRFYILPDEKMRVQLQDVDQEMLGMKNCWRCEYSLIHPDILKRAQLIQRDPKLAHYQIRSAGQTLNIIWSEQDQLVQKYELLKPTSGYAKTFTVRKIGQHVATPWTQTEKYSERDYADFSD